MNHMMYHTRTTQGLTLVEMLVVIAIIGILSSVVFASLSGARERARDEERVTELQQIALGLEMYYNSCRQYPNALNTGASNGCPTGTTLGSFLNTVPTDPQGADYGYAVDGTFSQYTLQTTFERDNRAMYDARNLDADPLGSLTCANADLNFCITSG